MRELVRQGFDDPLGLAVASLGEEARPLLRKGDDVGAIRLYAEQAAHGSTSGATSLLFMARAIVRDEARLQQVLREPLGQRLIATYAWTRGQESLWVDDTESPHAAAAPDGGARGRAPGWPGRTGWRRARGARDASTWPSDSPDRSGPRSPPG